MLKQKFLNTVKAIIKARVTWYLLGLLTPFLVIVLVIVILVIAGVEIPPPRAQQIVSKWGISEEEGKTLTITLRDWDNRFLTIGIERNDEDGLVKKVGVVKFGDDWEHGVFTLLYQVSGEYGAPMVVYGHHRDAIEGGLEIVWRDLNTDGQFDKRIDYDNHRTEIYVGDKWQCVLGQEERKVFTEEGVFKFDVESGRWECIAPAEPDQLELEGQEPKNSG